MHIVGVLPQNPGHTYRNELAQLGIWLNQLAPGLGCKQADIRNECIFVAVPLDTCNPQHLRQAHQPQRFQCTGPTCHNIISAISNRCVGPCVGKLQLVISAF